MSPVLFLDAMPVATRGIFNEFASLDNGAIPEGFFLIGGTGLALQLNHRLSEDLDFVVASNKLPALAIRALIETLTRRGHRVELITPVAAVHDFIDSGLDVDDYHQDWLIDQTKVTFFCFGDDAPYERDVIASLSKEACARIGGIVIPPASVIAKTKCAVMCRRIKSRDIFDLSALIKGDHLSFGEVIGEMKKASPHLNYEHLAHRLIYAKIPDDDEGLASVAGVDIDEVRCDLQAAKDRYEESGYLILAGELNCPDAATADAAGRSSMAIK